MAHRAQHLRCSLRCYVKKVNKRTSGWIKAKFACQASKTAFRSHCACPTGRYMCERGVLSEFRAARTCASYWYDKKFACQILPGPPRAARTSARFAKAKCTRIAWRCGCRLTTYRHRFARAAPAPRAKHKIQRIVDVHRPSSVAAHLMIIAAHSMIIEIFAAPVERPLCGSEPDNVWQMIQYLL